MPVDMHITDVAHIIQLAVAPVFLLSGVGVTLTVLTNRLSRIVDRARVLEERLPAASKSAKTDLHADLHTLSRRARFINWAISLTTCCGLLVCLLIQALFVGYFLGLDLSSAIALLFIVAMLAFVIAFVCFLREIFLATTSLRIGPY
ncbi:MAG: DUF2721 domain-containing protein [Sulfuricaulis sp.]